MFTKVEIEMTPKTGNKSIGHNHNHNFFLLCLCVNCSNHLFASVCLYLCVTPLPLGTPLFFVVTSYQPRTPDTFNAGTEEVVSVSTISKMLLEEMPLGLDNTSETEMKRNILVPLVK
jgi:hypothetical protein